MKGNILYWHDQLQEKKISCVELVQECIKHHNKQSNNTMISFLGEQALEIAQKRDLELNNQIHYLYGIPFTLKDLFITKGIRTTAGSKMLYNYIPPYEGFISERLQQVGGVMIGKVNCDEFGMGTTNEHSAYGAVKNPWNNNYVAGGSSGGSASSVVEQSSHYSIGTDTGGSIRLPANFCSLVGFKPSYGRVSRYGQIAYASSLDQSSPIAKTVMDIACIMEAITENDSRDSTHAGLGKLNIVESLRQQNLDFVKNKTLAFDPSFIDACQENVRKQLLESLNVFKKLGVKLREVSFPHFKYAIETYYMIAPSEASANLSRYDGIKFGYSAGRGEDLLGLYRKSRGEGFGPEVKRRIILGTFALSAGYYDAFFNKACKLRHLIAQDFENVFQDSDFIFSPVHSTTAMRLGEALTDTVKIYMNDLFTVPVNLAGLPAIALPYGRGENDLPTGFQLIGKRFQDDTLLKCAYNFEQAALSK